MSITRQAECERAVAEMFRAIDESSVAVFFGTFSDSPFRITLTRQAVDEDLFMSGDVSEVEALVEDGNDGHYARWIDRFDESDDVLDDLVSWVEDFFGEQEMAA